MGSQRYLAESLMRHFNITEDNAYQLTTFVESVQVGNELVDAVYPLTYAGDIQGSIRELTRIHALLGDNIRSLNQEFSALEPRIDNAIELGET